jgi:modification methylase nlaIII
MNYIGSKYKLLSFLERNIIETVGDIKSCVFCDLFAGTGVVGRYFKTLVKQIIANDIENYSYVLNRNYIGNHLPIEYQEKLDELNNLSGKKGFIYNNYCLGSGSERQYFSDNNGQKIDAIRLKIKEWHDKKYISDNEYFFFLASLLESADKVANTASVYGAFLKQLKKTAQKTMILEPALFQINDHDHEVYSEDANNLIRHIQGDILYLDPPYNERQYGANYHLLNTIALYDNFIPKGKTGLRNYTKSAYCKKAQVRESFDDLIRNAKFKYIFLSYNNEGLMSAEDIKNTMTKYGKYSLATTNYQRFKADSTREYAADKTTEYLHVLKKNDA